MMRALSLWQPHATAIALGVKPYETRGQWPFRYFGETLIHAAKNTRDMDAALSEPFRRVLQEAGIRRPLDLPLGAGVCVVDIAAIWKARGLGLRLVASNPARPAPETRFRDFNPPGQTLLPAFEFGDFNHGRYAIEVTSVRPLRAPVPIRGRQGLWTLSAEEEAAVRAQLLEAL